MTTINSHIIVIVIY